MTVQDLINQLLTCPGHLQVMVSGTIMGAPTEYGNTYGGSTMLLPTQITFSNDIHVVLSCHGKTDTRNLRTPNAEAPAR